MVKLKSDKDKLYQYMQEHQRELQSMDYIETMAAFVLLGETKRAEQILYRAEEGENVDMCKAIDKHMVMSNVHLVEKTGGKSGDFRF